MTGAAKALIAHGAVVSIDTTRSAVAQAALNEGAQIINDVSGGRLDRDLPHVVADHDCLYIVQHWRGWLAGSKGGAAPDADTSHYEHDVLKDVYDELMSQVDAVLKAGVAPERVIIDLVWDSPSPASSIICRCSSDWICSSGRDIRC